MKKWLKVVLVAALGAVLTGLFSATIYVSIIVVFQDSLGLGEPVWKGYFGQIGVLTYFSGIFLIAITIPAVIIVEIISIKFRVKIVIYYIVNFLVLYYCFVFAFDNNILTSIAVPIVGAGVYCIYQYLTSASRSLACAR